MAIKDSGDKLAKAIFGKSEVQNRIAINTVKMIVGDIVTLYQEFRKTEGLGALFFNPLTPQNSNYMTVADIRGDVALAEEIMDDDLKQFLNKLLKVIDKEQGEATSVVVMVNDQSMSIHVIELNSAEEQLAKLADAFTRD
jgi:uncharacterized protein YejL (UPF0352 family)